MICSLIAASRPLVAHLPRSAVAELPEYGQSCSSTFSTREATWALTRSVCEPTFPNKSTVCSTRSWRVSPGRCKRRIHPTSRQRSFADEDWLSDFETASGLSGGSSVIRQRPARVMTPLKSIALIHRRQTGDRLSKSGFPLPDSPIKATTSPERCRYSHCPTLESRSPPKILCPEGLNQSGRSPAVCVDSEYS